MFNLVCACRTVRRHRSGLPEKKNVDSIFNRNGKAPGTSPQKRNFTGGVLLQSDIHYSFYRPNNAALVRAVDPLSLSVGGCIGSIYREAATIRPVTVSTYRPQTMRHIRLQVPM